MRTPLQEVARWWALEVFANEVRNMGDWRMPTEFAQAVARSAVTEDILGWPDQDSAMAELADYGWIDP